MGMLKSGLAMEIFMKARFSKDKLQVCYYNNK